MVVDPFVITSTTNTMDVKTTATATTTSTASITAVFRNTFPSHYDTIPRPQTQLALFSRQLLLLIN
ncbi:hypothetical protein E2C01_064721 [Portunus trituberculatus]|uniref:Uncharacterized protein n=1 Tax=Portunus trituberculatus TaxID=210409 RepID=A0A5B7HGW9_PORTR|nr:hypothetical protein [Portunus trituberculatus]